MELKNFFALDNEGNKLPGATCYVYERGNSNLVGGLLKANGLPLNNPFLADNNGLAQFAAPNGLYDVRVAANDRDYRLHVQFNDVGESVAAAEQAASRAETAQEIAQYAADIKDSEAQGLAETLNGEYFKVAKTDAEQILVLYRNTGGAAVKIGEMPSGKAVDAVRELVNAGDDPFSVQDKNRFLIMRVLEDGTLDLPGAQIRPTEDGLELSDRNGFITSRLGATESTVNGWTTQAANVEGLEFVDKHNFMFGRVGQDKVYFGLPAEPHESVQVEPQEALLDRQRNTDHKGIINYGQSLSDGQNAQPSLSTVQEYGNLMLAGGVNVRPDEPGYVANRYAPLVEKDNGQRGETPVSGLCNGLVRRAIADGESAQNWVWVGAACGRGGKSVEQLSAAPLGDGYYEKMVQMIKDCHATSVAMGKTYSVWAYTWDQGESNYVVGSNKSGYQYVENMMNIFDGLTREVAVKVIGQTFRPYTFTYQVAAHRKYELDNMSIALAQWRLSRQRPDVVVVVPAYILPTGSDTLHLTNEASWLLGEYRSRAMYETMIRRSGKWRPLEPVSVEWKPEHIDIKFHVPRGELVLDDALAAMAPNFGFDIRESNVLKTDIISTVSVINTDTVRILLTRPTSNNATVSYARGRDGDPKASGPVTGARGNLRDTHGLFNTVESPLGNTFALHNPCVMFQYDRSTGF
ncbi:hypothetical protein C1882_07775 [Pseudomonas sp. FW305-E2]|uniref:sialate O-acetylesterase n=1 Tax=Pseudomonas sp. FW305-E2 TaxID=2075558 RepID=UPI000B4EACEA|nr:MULTISPECIES: sialate O-acetylesterase [Pseudomonas]POA86940.1 hypothetical protein C1882_07775 [Pseudomonas sp. FW305-E2]